MESARPFRAGPSLTEAGARKGCHAGSMGCSQVGRQAHATGDCAGVPAAVRLLMPPESFGRGSGRAAHHELHGLCGDDTQPDALVELGGARIRLEHVQTDRPSAGVSAM